jgi:hypothetical protein
MPNFCIQIHRYPPANIHRFVPERPAAHPAAMLNKPNPIEHPHLPYPKFTTIVGPEQFKQTP